VKTANGFVNYEGKEFSGFYLSVSHLRLELLISELSDKDPESGSDGGFLYSLAHN
jgi:hypothetical protein